MEQDKPNRQQKLSAYVRYKVWLAVRNLATSREHIRVRLGLAAHVLGDIMPELDLPEEMIEEFNLIKAELFKLSHYRERGVPIRANAAALNKAEALAGRTLDFYTLVEEKRRLWCCDCTAF